MSSTFERFAPRLEVQRLVETGELPADRLVSAVRELDAAVARVEGHGFEPTPFGAAPELAEAVGIGDSELWVKDETGNVSGSHKARHLFGVALAHRMAGAGRRGRGAPRMPSPAAETPRWPPRWWPGLLAGASTCSCRPGPNDAVVARITELGGRVVRCEREPGVPGDPAHHAMLAAIEAGAVPFSCQGTETPATIDGGRTLAWEMVDSLVEHDGERPARLNRLFVQVGGGALATAVVTGLAAAVGRGDLGSNAQGPRGAARGQSSPGEGLGHAGA